MNHKIEIVVAGDENSGRLDSFLAAQLEHESRTRLKALIEQGLVMVNGKAAKPSHQIKPGDRIEVAMPEPKPARPLPEDIPLEVLYEDRDLIVINKPAGLMTHPATNRFSGTLVNALLYHCKDLSGIGGELKPGIVHRLDKLTSGVMVAAKNDQAHRQLSEQFKKHSIDRQYLALVWGNPEGDSGRIESKISRNPRHRLKMTSRTGQGRTAITEWKVVKRFKHFSLIQCRLLTGRTHQIRVHLTEMGFPLVGDALYGRGRGKPQKINMQVWAAVKRLDRQALHAFQLGFIHPATGKSLEFNSPLPHDLASLLKLLEKYDP